MIAGKLIGWFGWLITNFGYCIGVGFGGNGVGFGDNGVGFGGSGVWIGSGSGGKLDGGSSEDGLQAELK